MKKEIRDKLNLWHNQIKEFDKLKLNEAKKLYKLMQSSTGEIRNKYREKLMLGTLYVVYYFVCNSGLTDIEASYFDIDDIINISNEIWIEMINRGDLLRVNYYSELFNKTFYNKINYLLNDSNHHTSNIMTYCNLDEAISNIYNNNINNLTKTRLDLLKNIILETAIIDKKIDIDKFYVDDFTNNLTKTIVEKEIVDFIFDFGFLKKREETIIKERYGFVDGKYKTIQELGENMGISWQRVHQIEESALKKLRREKTYIISLGKKK